LSLILASELKDEMHELGSKLALLIVIVVVICQAAGVAFMVYMKRRRPKIR
jgi:hypothetical protein